MKALDLAAGITHLVPVPATVYPEGAEHLRNQSAMTLRARERGVVEGTKSDRTIAGDHPGIEEWLPAPDHTLRAHVVDTDLIADGIRHNGCILDAGDPTDGVQGHRFRARASEPFLRLLAVREIVFPIAVPKLFIERASAAVLCSQQRFLATAARTERLD